MKKSKTLYRVIAALAAVLAGVLASPAGGVEFQDGELSGNFDTTVSYGLSVRVEERDDNQIGKANLNPALTNLFLTNPVGNNAAFRAAPGRYSVNSDDGDLNYDKGDLIANTLKVSHELTMDWRNFSAFFRGYYFYDFENDQKDELSDVAKQFVGSDAKLLDAWVQGDFEPGGTPVTVRLGRQVISWGESTFIQGGINVINPVDVSKIRLAGAELKEAFLPVDSIWGNVDLSDNVSLEGFYLFEFEQIDPDPAGTYFSTNDFAVPGGQFVMLGFGLVDEGTPGLTIPRADNVNPSKDDQYGVALRWFLPQLNDTELGFYYMNLHSRLPLISGTSVTNASPASGRYFVEYPEDIHTYGISWNSTLGNSGIAFQGEYTYRPNQPLQIDDVEVLFAALSPLNAGIPAPANRFLSQLGSVGFGEYVQGWDEHEVSQLQFTLTKAFGPGWIGADQWIALGEAGFTYVHDLPPKDVLRYQGDGTDTGGGADVLSGLLRNPETETDGFADDFSWGYRALVRAEYLNAIGPINLAPRIAFNQDVSGTSPGPGGNFIEGRKSLTIAVSGDYLQKWSAEVAYTRFWGAEHYNLLSDRDFASLVIRYSF